MVTDGAEPGNSAPASRSSTQHMESDTRALVACSMCALFAGCGTPLTTYSPTPNQRVEYDQGVAVTWDAEDAVLTMYPASAKPRFGRAARSWARSCSRPPPLSRAR